MDDKLPGNDRAESCKWECAEKQPAIDLAAYLVGHQFCQDQDKCELHRARNAVQNGPGDHLTNAMGSSTDN